MTFVIQQNSGAIIGKQIRCLIYITELTATRAKVVSFDLCEEEGISKDLPSLSRGLIPEETSISMQMRYF